MLCEDVQKNLGAVLQHNIESSEARDKFQADFEQYVDELYGFMRDGIAGDKIGTFFTVADTYPLERERLRTKSASFGKRLRALVDPAGRLLFESQARQRFETMAWPLKQSMEQLEKAIALITPSRDGPEHPPKAMKGNISGPSWQEVLKGAEKYLADGKTFPGVGNMAKRLGCSENTLRKAIKNSKILQQAKQKCDFQADRPTAESLTEAVAASLTENREIDPSEAADTDALLKRLLRETPPPMLDETKAKIDAMNEEGKQALAAQYAKQIDEKQQDDRETRKPRTRRP